MFMKFKLKPAWIGLFLIGVMLFSTFAYAVIQSFYYKPVKLPTTNVINYKLDINLKNALMQYSGATIITFNYNLACENCISQKSILEFYANEHKEQIFLEELLDDSLDKSRITIESVYGKEELVDSNETQIFAALCKLMVAPPATCTLITP